MNKLKELSSAPQTLLVMFNAHEYHIVLQMNVSLYPDGSVFVETHADISSDRTSGRFVDDVRDATIEYLTEFFSEGNLCDDVIDLNIRVSDAGDVSVYPHPSLNWGFESEEEKNLAVAFTDYALSKGLTFGAVYQIFGGVCRLAGGTNGWAKIN